MGEPALYTASVVLEQGLSCAHMFAALMAFDEEDAKAKLGLRVGREQAGAAQFRRGFDSSDPVACSLLSDPLTEILLDVREDGRPTLAAGLENFPGTAVQELMDGSVQTYSPPNPIVVPDDFGLVSSAATW